MPLRTTAIDIARERGLTMVELAERSGLSLRVLYYLRDGRQPSSETMQALMGVFPDIPFGRLFVPVDSAFAQSNTTKVETAA